MLVNNEEGKVPFKTWYSRIAATVPGSAAASLLPGMERKLLNAAFDGARIVMPVVMPERVDINAGCAARRLFSVERVEFSAASTSISVISAANAVLTSARERVGRCILKEIIEQSRI